MLGHTVVFPLLLLLKGARGQGCLGSTDAVFVLSGEPLSLRPPNSYTEVSSVKWKMRLSSLPDTYVILTWKNASLPSYSSSALKHFNHALDFKDADLTLVIQAAKPQDGGLYCLEVTKESGEVCRAEFNVSVFGPVEQPLLQGQGQALDGGECQVALSCSVSGDDNLSYAWYRGNELIQTARNHAYLEVQSGGPHMYTCNVSNSVSWASHTVNLTQACRPATKSSTFLSSLVASTILVLLLLGMLTCFCVWKRKRRQLQTSPKNFLTIYEDVKDLRSRRNEEPRPTGQERTIYSLIQLQSPAPASQEVANTLYSSTQPSRKSGSKKRNRSPSANGTVYEEVGKRQHGARNPARLSRRELQNFDIYP